MSASCSSVSLELSLAEYDSIISPLLARSTLPIDNVLAALDLLPGDIDEVVMVGGTSRIPQVREEVKRSCEKTELNTHIDPDVTVAYGCAAVID